MDTIDPKTLKRRVPLLINRNFALLWVGGVISSFGDFIFNTTLVLWIATSLTRGQSWSPLAVSGIFIAASIPTFTLGPIAGVFIDRWRNKRAIMLCMDATRAVLVALLLLATGSLPLSLGITRPTPTFWQLGATYAIVLLVSVCDQFFNPANSVLFNDIVEEAYRTRASGLSQTVRSLAIIAGPPLGTLLFFAVGVRWALVLNSLSFIASFLTILAMRLSEMVQKDVEEKRKTFLHDFSEGIHFYATNAVLMTLLITGVLIIIWDSAFGALGVFFVTQNLHAPVSYYGFLGTAIGAGLTVGALLTSLIAPRIGVTRVFWSSIILSGLLIILQAHVTQFLAALIFLFLIGVLFAATNVTVSPILLHVTPRQFIGRVATVINPVMTLTSTLTAAIAGWLDSTLLRNVHGTLLGVSFGPLDTMFSVMGVFTILGGVYALVNLRGVKIAKENGNEA